MFNWKSYINWKKCREINDVIERLKTIKGSWDALDYLTACLISNRDVNGYLRHELIKKICTSTSTSYSVLYNDYINFSAEERFLLLNTILDNEGGFCNDIASLIKHGVVFTNTEMSLIVLKIIARDEYELAKYLTEQYALPSYLNDILVAKSVAYNLENS